MPHNLTPASINDAFCHSFGQPGANYRNYCDVMDRRAFLGAALLAAAGSTVGASTAVAASQVFNRGIPGDAHAKLVELAPRGVTTFAFTPAGGWVVVTALGDCASRDLPAECLAKLNEFVANGHRIHCVAFPPAGGNSWVITTDWGLYARNIPPECYSKLVEQYNAGNPVVHVGFPPAGGNSWVVLGANGYFFARNIDDECYQMMRNLTQGGRKVTRVAFPNTGGWAVIAQDEFHTRKIDDECYLQMNNFSLRGYEVHNIAFAPFNNGWSLVSRGAPPPLPFDHVRHIENTVGGGNIWQRMAAYNTPGVAIGVTIKYRPAWSTGYGWLEAGSAAATHPESVFQAASISKAVATMGVLRLLQTHKIPETDDIRPYLGWNLPVRPCLTAYKPPAIANVLTHTAGITGRGNTFPVTNCSGFTGDGGGYAGYGPGVTVPTLLQVMNGQPPATGPRIEISSGSRDRYYSGAGFVLLQRMIEQQSGQTLSAYMAGEIFARLGMSHSTYDLYPSWELASGHETTGAVIPGKRFRYPEGAAAGLYTDVLDLCRLVGHINLAWASPGDVAGAPLTKESVKRMLTPGPSSTMGRGWNLDKIGTSAFSYYHFGDNRGFTTEVRGFPQLSTGYAILANGDNRRSLVNEIASAIRTAYGWT